MARRFAKVSEEEIVAIDEAVFFYPSDLVNTKTTIPLRLCVSVYIHHWYHPTSGLMQILHFDWLRY